MTEFRPKMPLDFCAPPFRVRTIRSSEDLQKVLELRRQCFEADIDKMPFDLQADHLIVETMEDQRLCGTYRISHSDFCHGFECEEDFQMDSWLKKPGAKMELAWACVAPEHRHGRVLSLLWRGIRELARESQTKYVFGTTSIQGTPARLIEIQGALGEFEFISDIQPQAAKYCHQLDSPSAPTPAAKKSFRRLIPNLLRAYIVAGALVCTQPSFDADLGCYDFMTVMDIDAL
jgi:putative hemolysin